MTDSRRNPSQPDRNHTADLMRAFRAYAVWLVSIRWRRFWLYAGLLLVASGILGEFLPSHTVTEWIDVSPPKPPRALRSPEAAKDAENATGNAHEAARVERRLRTRRVDADNPFPPAALLLILASAILKSAYKGRLQAEGKAAAATENAESEQLKRQVVEARMAAMQAQVEPHFLFNTLASIDHLIETDPPRASQMQKNLIALLRASMPTLREGHPVAPNLGREMSVIRPYLEILKVRMEDRLQTVIDVPDGLLSADFPPMMIQGLVENAIKHGLEPKPQGGQLSVRAEVTDGRLVVTVADTGLGVGHAATTGTGVGLTNLRERLQLLYGPAGTMTIADNPPSGTRVSVTLPYQFKARDAAAS